MLHPREESRRPRPLALVPLALTAALLAPSCKSEPDHPLETVEGLAELYQHMGRERVVRVHAVDRKGDPLLGKGVAIGDGSWILTSSHLIEEGDSVRVENVDAIGGEAELVTRDAETGLALLRLDHDRLEGARLGLDTFVETGQDVYLMIDDEFVDVAYASARVTGRREAAGGDLLRLNGFVRPEEYGGPVFDAGGAVVGVVIPDDLVDRNVRASYAQPGSTLLAFLQAAGGPIR